MHVAGGAQSAHWRDAARAAVEAIATLREGEAHIDDTEIVITGTGTAGAIAALRRKYQTPTSPFHVRLDLTAGQQP